MVDEDSGVDYSGVKHLLGDIEERKTAVTADVLRKPPNSIGNR